MGKRWLYWPDASGGGGGGGGSDPLFASVCLRMPLDGADGDLNILPGKKNYATAGTPLVPEFRSVIELDNTTHPPKFGTTCIFRFDGNLRAIMPGDGGGDETFSFGLLPWSFECWGRWLNEVDRDKLNNVTWRRRTLFAKFTGSPGGWSFAYKPYEFGPNMIFEWRTVDEVVHTLEGGGSMPYGVWVHYAVERGDDDILRIFVNGTVVASTNVAGHNFKNNTGGPSTIGQQDNANSSYFNGAIDDIRVTCGVERWGGSFDVPTEALPLS